MMILVDNSVRMSQKWFVTLMTLAHLLMQYLFCVAKSDHLMRMAYWAVVEAVRVRVSPSPNTTSSGIAFPGVARDYTCLCSFIAAWALRTKLPCPHFFPFHWFFLQTESKIISYLLFYSRQTNLLSWITSLSARVGSAVIFFHHRYLSTWSTLCCREKIAGRMILARTCHLVRWPVTYSCRHSYALRKGCLQD